MLSVGHFGGMGMEWDGIGPSLEFIYFSLIVTYICLLGVVWVGGGRLDQ